MHNGGYFHPSGHLNAVQPLASKPARPIVGPTRNFSALIERWRREKAGELEPFAAILGVERQDLMDLHTCWANEYKAFAFPMYNPGGDVVGIRLRNDFHKWSVKGGHNGLFIPWGALKRLPLDVVMICEGPTDTAAGLALGIFSIGRPMCLGCEDMVSEVLKQIKPKTLIVCFDNDERVVNGKRIRPGPIGAERLISHLRCRATRFVPPTKDLRSFLTGGGSRSLLLSIIGGTVRT
jgi:hypothetical protein